MNENQSVPDDVMNYKGLSAYLKLSQNTLRHKVMKGTIPFVKIGSSVRFSKKSIDKWLAELQQETKSVQVAENNEVKP